MTKQQFGLLARKIRLLTLRRSKAERLAMGFTPMLAASLLERRFRTNGPVAYYLSIPNAQTTSRHRYVRKGDVEAVRRQTEAWREFSRAMAEWVRINKVIERILRRLGEGRRLKIDLG
jgi:hypothetical protein